MSRSRRDRRARERAQVARLRGRRVAGGMDPQVADAVVRVFRKYRAAGLALTDPAVRARMDAEVAEVIARRYGTPGP